MAEQERDVTENRMTAREVSADEAPVQASDPRSLIVDRAGVTPASPGASEDELAAAERAENGD